MAPLPENATARYFVDYTDGINEHTLLFRGLPGTSAALLGGIANNVIQELQPNMYLGWAIVGARFSQAGSDFSLPVLPPNQVTPGSNIAMPGTAAPRFQSIIGRGVVSGRRFRMFFFGLNIATPNDFRIDTGEVTSLDNARSQLIEAFGDNNIVTIGGDTAVLYDYFNVGFNSYYERKQRG